MTNYKISIIIPVYNAEQFILNTLSSIENQTMDFEDIEVVLVNDCSSDNTEKILNEYAENHDNIVPIHLKDNAGGPAIPRNIGITYATADYLMFLDQDDTFKENSCEVLYHTIVDNDVDMVCGNHNMVYNGQSNLCFNFDWAQSEKVKIKNIHENPNFLTMGVAAWSKIFRKSFILENNIKFTEGVGEDIFFSIRALLLANGIILLKNFVVVDYQVRGESLSHQVDFNYVKEFSQFYSTFFTYCKDNCIGDDLYLPLFNGRMNNLLSILFYADLNPDELSLALCDVQKLCLELNKKSFFFFNNHYQLLFEFLIKDKFPFEKSSAIYNFLKLARSNQLNADLKDIVPKCALYVDLGNGFNEKDKLVKNYNVGYCNEIVFNLSDFKNIKNICFKPIEGCFTTCIVSEISSENKKFSFEAINCDNSSDFQQIFFTFDPQYRINGDFEGINKIKIKFLVKFIDNAEIINITENFLLN